jgi:hypothetical protein
MNWGKRIAVQCGYVRGGADCTRVQDRAFRVSPRTAVRVVRAGQFRLSLNTTTSTKAQFVQDMQVEGLAGGYAEPVSAVVGSIQGNVAFRGGRLEKGCAGVSDWIA